MKRNAFVFLEITSFGFFGQFGEFWAKTLRTPKNLPAPTPMLASFTCGVKLREYCHAQV